MAELKNPYDAWTAAVKGSNGGHYQTVEAILIEAGAVWSPAQVAHYLWRLGGYHGSGETSKTPLDSYDDLRRELGLLPPLPDPTPPPGSGMDIAVDDYKGKVIGFGPPDNFFFGSRVAKQFDHERISAHFRDPAQTGMNCEWVSLSTGSRASDRQQTFDCRTKPGTVAGKLEHMIELGIAPIIEAASQEFMDQVIGEDLTRALKYLDDVADIMRGRCRLAFVYREMGDLRWGHAADKKRRMAAYSNLNSHLSQLLGPDVLVGVHTRGLEALSAGYVQNMPHDYCHLLHWPLRADPRKGFYTDHAPGHQEVYFENAGEWAEAWYHNRVATLSDRYQGWIAYEHTLGSPPAGTTVWGGGWMPAEAEFRGDVFRDRDGFICDTSGGVA